MISWTFSFFFVEAPPKEFNAIKFIAAINSIENCIQNVSLDMQLMWFGDHINKSYGKKKKENEKKVVNTFETFSVRYCRRLFLLCPKPFDLFVFRPWIPYECTNFANNSLNYHLLLMHTPYTHNAINNKNRIYNHIVNIYSSCIFHSISILTRQCGINSIWTSY